MRHLWIVKVWSRTDENGIVWIFDGIWGMGKSKVEVEMASDPTARLNRVEEIEDDDDGRTDGR